MRFLGSITAASGGYNNLQTGVSGIGTFDVPTGTKALLLQPSASGVQFELFMGVTGATNTTAARGAFLNFGQGNAINGPFRKTDDAGCVVAIYNQAGGFVSCKVYAVYR